VASKQREPALIVQLRDAIRHSGRTLNQLSIASGVSSAQLSRFMTGKRTLTLPAAAKICEALHLQLAGSPSAADVQEGPPPSERPSEKKPRRKV